MSILIIHSIVVITANLRSIFQSSMIQNTSKKSCANLNQKKTIRKRAYFPYKNTISLLCRRSSKEESVFFYIRIKSLLLTQRGCWCCWSNSGDIFGISFNWLNRASTNRVNDIIDRDITTEVPSCYCFKYQLKDKLMKCFCLFI